MIGPFEPCSKSRDNTWFVVSMRTLRSFIDMQRRISDCVNATDNVSNELQTARAVKDDNNGATHGRIPEPDTVLLRRKEAGVNFAR
jgi:hypothetical protein